MGPRVRKHGYSSIWNNITIQKTFRNHFWGKVLYILHACSCVHKYCMSHRGPIVCCHCIVSPVPSLLFNTTEYTQSGNGHFLAYIPSWWKNQPSLVRMGGGGARTPPFTISIITKLWVVVYAPTERVDTTESIGIEMKYGECICPLSWSVHCNFVRDGK
jgi:hypothetical protein